MARIKASLLNKCDRCRNAITPENQRVINVHDDFGAYAGCFQVCDTCAGQVPVGARNLQDSDGVDLLVNWISNGLIEIYVPRACGITYRDIANKLDLWMGNRAYCLEMVRLAKEEDPAREIVDLYNKLRLTQS